MVTMDMPLIAIGYKYNARKVLFFIVTDNKGSKKLVLPIYLSILNNLIILPFALLLVPLLCQKNLLLMRLTLTKNQDSLIWNCRSDGLLSVVVWGYVRQLLWE